MQVENLLVRAFLCFIRLYFFLTATHVYLFLLPFYLSFFAFRSSSKVLFLRIKSLLTTLSGRLPIFECLLSGGSSKFRKASFAC
jgi:hypothetical protein